MSESVKQQMAKLDLRDLRYLNCHIHNIKKKKELFKLFKEIKMWPGKAGKYESDIDSEMKMIMLKCKT